MVDKPPASIKELYKLVTDMNESLKKEVEEMKASMGYMNKTFEELRTTKDELAALKKEHAALKAEKEQLAESLACARNEIVELKQYSRKNNIEIKGVPEEKDESLVEVVQNIVQKVGTTVEPSEIDVVHRVPTRNKESSNIIVRFVSRGARDRVLQGAKKHRLAANDIGFSSTHPVFINEHLCPEYKALLGMAIAKKKEKNWRFVWVSQSKILARRTENSKTIHIASTDDLSKIV